MASGQRLQAGCTLCAVRSALCALATSLRGRYRALDGQSCQGRALQGGRSSEQGRGSGHRNHFATLAQVATSVMNAPLRPDRFSSSSWSWLALAFPLALGFGRERERERRDGGQRTATASSRPARPRSLALVTTTETDLNSVRMHEHPFNQSLTAAAPGHWPLAQSDTSLQGTCTPSDMGPPLPSPLSPGPPSSASIQISAVTERAAQPDSAQRAAAGDVHLRTPGTGPGPNPVEAPRSDRAICCARRAGRSAAYSAQLPAARS